MPSQELGASAHRKYDMEAWLPGKEFWGEVCRVIFNEKILNSMKTVKFSLIFYILSSEWRMLCHSMYCVE